MSDESKAAAVIQALIWKCEKWDFALRPQRSYLYTTYLGRCACPDRAMCSLEWGFSIECNCICHKRLMEAMGVKWEKGAPIDRS